MPKVDVTWKEKEKGKEESILISHPAWGTYELPARKFNDISLEGNALLREHGYGTFFGEKDFSLEIKRGRDPSDQYIASVYVNENHIIDIWCDRIDRFGPNHYCFYMKGENVGGVYAEKVSIADELKDFVFKPTKQD